MGQSFQDRMPECAGRAQGGETSTRSYRLRILSLFAENEFYSVRTLAQELGVSLSTVYDRLVNLFGFSLRHVRPVPYLFTGELKAQGISTSMEMLRILQTQKPMNLAAAITGDESWFFLEYSRNRVWRLGDENVPERVSQKISTRKHMLPVCCSPMGLLVEEWLPEHDMFNSKYFCAASIPRLASSVFPY
jgi:AraC-like DNA-binding protein